jgi:hypothetical protein
MSKQKEKNDVSAVQGNACQRGRSSSTALKDTPNHNDHVNSLPKMQTLNIRRKAFDWIGRVGYQYDASQDKVIKNFRLLHHRVFSSEVKWQMMIPY